ncbi:BTAD domain-containing putative transcriptional regulator [Lentzea sp. BCCO 10_0856]|uniref:BTAD domain-containing putative transcriptional regulator n=1 Tax=Lentzea miocenica TaxID=3095431 RepID=A0ABU4SZP8_9PSEU|nr:BTAD domain-containing putative transcriptional regulator [Lentzea sp. BCCO 10_0856]MDX8031381.1 BTAD domain-containing putative transcriptional regulator [Lentzea sp. BCCO 10_0856]
MDGPHLRVLGGFTVRLHDRPVRLPLGAQRLLAFLATQARPQDRTHIAQHLWPDLSEARAAGTMRSALWQIRRRLPGMVTGDVVTVVLGPVTDVDLWRTTRYAFDLPGNGGSSCWREFIDDLSCDLLPHWSDDWLTLERERYRQIRLHTLETLCRQLTGSGDTQPAIEVALRAVGADPLRETAQRALIEAHLADGNISEAIRQYDSYVQILRQTLGVAPTSALCALLPRAPYHRKPR